MISVRLAEVRENSNSFNVVFPSWTDTVWVETRPSYPKMTSYQLRKFE